MDVDRLNELETIDPRPLAPWCSDAFTKIKLERDRETARETADSARNTSDIVVYSDASGREGHLGAAIVALNDNDEVTESQQQVGPMERWSVHVAELIGIFYAVSVVFKLVHHRSIVENHMHATVTVLCDSRSQAIQNVRNRSGQRIIHALLQAATEVQAGHISLRLQWMLGHCGNVGNETADRLAKGAAQPGKTHPSRPLLTRKNAFRRGKIHAHWEQEWKSSTKGAHLRKVGGALPARYTRKLYGNLPRNRAYLFTQLRTEYKLQFIQVSLQTVIYSIKLKLEFTLLYHLRAAMHSDPLVFPLGRMQDHWSSNNTNFLNMNPSPISVALEVIGPSSADPAGGRDRCHSLSSGTLGYHETLREISHRPVGT